MADQGFSDSCMIALYPPADLAEPLTLEGGLPAEEMHVTVAYCGKAADVDASVLLAVAQGLAARPPIRGSFSGSARFSGGESDVAVALVDSADLEDLRRDLLDALGQAAVTVPREHGFTAHLTRAYIAPEAPAPDDRISAPVTFGALSVVHGSDRTDFPFASPAHPIEAFARQAFAAGWAASGGPMTDRVRAGCTTAVQLAVESADNPDVLKATVDLGKLEGMWALLFQRREDLLAQHAAALTAAWRPLLSHSRVTSGVEQFRSRLGLAEAVDTTVKSEATAAAQAMLHGITDEPGFADLRSRLLDAITAGRAEGMVDAVALAAERAHRDGLDWDAGFADAYSDVQRLEGMTAQADTWLRRLVDRAATDLASVLTSHATNDTTTADASRSAYDAVAGKDIPAVEFTADWAITTAASVGVLDILRSEGVAYADWVTVGDSVVCPTCKANETGNPWPLHDFPAFPAHPRCRCIAEADFALSRYDSWFA